MNDIPSPYIKDASQKALYTLDDVREVWYFAMIHGATLWAYSQDKKRTLPDDFNKGLNAMREHIKDASTLAFLLSNTAVMMGLYDELLDIDKVTTNTSVPLTDTEKAVSKKNKSGKSQVKDK